MESPTSLNGNTINKEKMEDKYYVASVKKPFQDTAPLLCTIVGHRGVKDTKA